MSGLRILHLIASLGGGGAERQLAYLVGAQARSGHEPHVGVRAGGVNAHRFAPLGERLHRLPVRGNHDPRGVADVAGLIRRVRPDVVQTWLPLMDVLGGTAARLCRVPWVLAERASDEAYPASAKNRLRLRIAASASAIVANSRRGELYWARSGPASVRRFVVPNGVPVEEIAAVAASDEDRSPPRPFFVFAGRLTGQKNLPAHLAAFRLLPDGLDVRLLICGEGPERAAVAAAIAQDPVLAARVQLGGYREDLWSLLKCAAGFLSVSRFEGHPNTVLEAMACGCPLVVSDIPEHREFLDEQSALLVGADDAAGIAAAVRAVLGDPGAARRRAAAAAARVERFSVAANARGYEAVYAAVLRGGPAPARTAADTGAPRRAVRGAPSSAAPGSR